MLVVVPLTQFHRREAAFQYPLIAAADAPGQRALAVEEIDVAGAGAVVARFPGERVASDEEVAVAIHDGEDGLVIVAAAAAAELHLERRLVPAGDFEERNGAIGEVFAEE